MADNNIAIKATLITKDGSLVCPVTSFDSVYNTTSYAASDPTGFEMLASVLDEKTPVEVDADSTKFLVIHDSSLTITDLGMDASEGAMSLLNGTGKFVHLDSSYFVYNGEDLSLTDMKPDVNPFEGTSEANKHYIMSVDASSGVHTNDFNLSAIRGGSASLYFDNNFNLFTTSDERLKDIHGDLKVTPEDVRSIRKILYRYKGSESSCDSIGVTAQSVQNVVPELVSSDENGTLSVSYDRLSVVALAAIDALQAEIESLRKEIELLKK